ncbi:MAG: carotenoid oxygenase family protein, partial [Actinomycetota bacterium]
VILSAADVAGEPLATIHLPRRVPFGFHGSWVPA